MNALAHRNLFVPALVTLVFLAWVTLWFWEGSPYGRFLNHAELGELSLRQGTGRLLLQAGLYVAGWTLMTVAMMLPTTLPLLEIFRGSLFAYLLGFWLFFVLLVARAARGGKAPPV